MTTVPAIHRKRACDVTACLVLGGCAVSVVQADNSPAVLAASGNTILDGVFSYEQGRRGEALYLEICEGCREKDLLGGSYAGEFVPPAAGIVRPDSAG